MKRIFGTQKNFKIENYLKDELKILNFSLMI